MRNVKLPYSYVQESPETLEDFLLIKQEYSNGIIYDPRKHIIYSRLRSRGYKKYSIQKITSLFKYWLILGWVEEKDGCYHFASNKNKKNRSVKINDLTFEIRKQIILNNLKQQQFARDTKTNLKNPRGRFAYLDHKRAKKNIKKLNGDASRANYDLDLKLAFSTMAKLTGYSQTTAYRDMDRMISSGIITKGKAKYYRRSNNGYLTRIPNCYSLSI